MGTARIQGRVTQVDAGWVWSGEITVGTDVWTKESEAPFPTRDLALADLKEKVLEAAQLIHSILGVDPEQELRVIDNKLGGVIRPIEDVLKGTVH